MDIKENINRNRVGSEFWINSEGKTFSEIIEGNRTMFGHWSSSKTVQDSYYSDNILKPINGYAMEFWPKPKMIKENEIVYLRYFTHAEIWFDVRKDGLYALDKTWQRQFYPSEVSIAAPKNFFNSIYKFYIPWIFDEDLTLEIRELDDSPFKILNKKVKFKKLDKDKNWNCDWFHFLIKSDGEHVEDYNNHIYGIIPVKTPICDIIIKDKDLINKIEKEYDK